MDTATMPVAASPPAHSADLDRPLPQAAVHRVPAANAAYAAARPVLEEDTPGR
ncbi:hypothetical protein OG609_01875 [Streptomyces sp. NBC_01224]|uniref:hypothetical protein n=1 Tax=unclassified Streptomyces TaxID=2593676 RepID=UPI002E0DCAB9|nr:hypothetical protein OG609_01875 [Streptomyces sp. NBC_01224]